MRARTRPLGSLFVAGSIAIFVLGMAIAMTAYPGGTWCDRAAPGHDFLRNFFCDLLHDVALDGRPNAVGAGASRTAMLALLAGLLGAFWIAPRTFGTRPWSSRLVRAAGVLCALGGVGVAFTPSNHFPRLHTISVFAATFPGLLAMILASAAQLRAEDARATARLGGLLGVAAVVVGAFDAWLYARQLDGSHQCELLLPALERVAAALLLAWMAVVAVRDHARAHAEG